MCTKLNLDRDAAPGREWERVGESGRKWEKVQKEGEVGEWVLKIFVNFLQDIFSHTFHFFFFSNSTIFP